MEKNDHTEENRKFIRKLKKFTIIFIILFDFLIIILKKLNELITIIKNFFNI